MVGGRIIVMKKLSIILLAFFIYSQQAYSITVGALSDENIILLQCEESLEELESYREKNHMKWWQIGFEDRTIRYGLSDWRISFEDEIRVRGESVLFGTIIFNRVVNTLTMISDTTKERREFYCKLLKQQY